MEHLPGHARFSMLPFALGPSTYHNSGLSLVLRHARVVLYGLRQIQLARQLGQLSDSITMSVLHSCLFDVVHGMIFGPAVVELGAEVLDLALSCNRDAVIAALPAISSTLPGQTAHLALLVLQHLYCSTRALPTAVSAQLAQKLRVLLPLAMAVPNPWARPRQGLVEVVAYMVGELEQQVGKGGGEGAVRPS